ncbi:AraC family transcriptional regulator [Roseivirga sp. 4D4]|uniref:helix-turn-helix domain-containing protein n=1 Tax=Roseivirga sp. 4D4 TaxID=1889784 RepID=UPI000852EFA7|nr:helix-turn-helix domain-containing protein [Roseivirga sp. 4D4]OEK01492.1 AraC family transcriptional regulator [Roseivirga sp. 4D4]
MIFEFHRLTPPLDQWIESIFYYKDFQPDHSIERVVPTGHVFIIFELDGIKRNTFDNESLVVKDTFEKVWISGVHKNYLSISAHQDSEMLVIQFKPQGSLPFLHTPVHTLNDKVVPAQDVLGDTILSLRDEVKNQDKYEHKFSVVERWLNRRYFEAYTPPESLLSIVYNLSTKPFNKHKSVVSEYPQTQKNLIDQFKKHCGYTPKVFHRICRFNEILRQIGDKEKINWSQIAYEYDYADQSHFIKEFKEFSGFSPEEFIKNGFHNDEPNFFPLDREG